MLRISTFDLLEHFALNEKEKIFDLVLKFKHKCGMFTKNIKNIS